MVAIPALLALVFGGLIVVSSSSSASKTPQSLWAYSVVPRSPADSEVAKVELGTQFRTSVPGKVTALRHYAFATSIGPSRGSLWDAKGRKLASVKFRGTRGEGWKKAALSRPVSLKVGTTYVVSYSSGGHYAGDNDYFPAGSPLRSGPLTATAGVYRYGAGFPTQVWHDSAYYADVVFVAAAPTLGNPTTTPSTGTTPTSTPGPSPSVSPTPKPTPTSSQGTSGKNCAALPSRCGYPDASTTGPTLKLKRIPEAVTSGPGWHWTGGEVRIDGDGANFAGYAVESTIDVNADNVKISDVDILVGGETWGISLRHAQGTVINKVKVTAPNMTSRRLMVGIGDVYGDVKTLTVRNSNISGTATGIQVHAGLIENNYIHDLGFKGDDHVNGFTSNSGTTQLTIRHNTVFNQLSQTDAVSLFQDFGPQRNRLITGNLMAGGGYTLYAGANTGKESTATNIILTNNRFSRRFYPRGGYYGPYTAYTSGGGNVLTGNIWDDTGGPL